MPSKKALQLDLFSAPPNLKPGAIVYFRGRKGILKKITPKGRRMHIDFGDGNKLVSVRAKLVLAKNWNLGYTLPVGSKGNQNVPRA